MVERVDDDARERARVDVVREDARARALEVESMAMMTPPGKMLANVERAAERTPVDGERFDASRHGVGRVGVDGARAGTHAVGEKALDLKNKQNWRQNGLRAWFGHAVSGIARVGKRKRDASDVDIGRDSVAAVEDDSDVVRTLRRELRGERERAEEATAARDEAVRARIEATKRETTLKEKLEESVRELAKVSNELEALKAVKPRDLSTSDVSREEFDRRGHELEIAHAEIESAQKREKELCAANKNLQRSVKESNEKISILEEKLTTAKASNGAAKATSKQHPQLEEANAFIFEYFRSKRCDSASLDELLRALPPSIDTEDFLVALAARCVDTAKLSASHLVTVHQI